MEVFGYISVNSNSLTSCELQDALSENSDEMNIVCYRGEQKRGFTDAEWVTFALMSIPAAESVFNIVVMIKNEIRSRIEKQMSQSKINKTVKINVKINLPLFSYEKTEEILIEVSNEN